MNMIGEQILQKSQLLGNKSLDCYLATQTIAMFD